MYPSLNCNPDLTQWMLPVYDALGPFPRVHSYTSPEPGGLLGASPPHAVTGSQRQML